jgi:hypothetical protein
MTSMSNPEQLPLFGGQNLNIVYEVKRQIRIALSRTKLSRDEVVDRVAELARRDGAPVSITKPVLDSWCKESDPGRMPSIAAITILCHVLGTVEPLRAMASALGAAVINSDDLRILNFGRAEIARRRAQKSARKAADELGL